MNTFLLCVTFCFKTMPISPGMNNRLLNLWLLTRHSIILTLQLSVIIFSCQSKSKWFSACGYKSCNCEEQKPGGWWRVKYILTAEPKKEWPNSPIYTLGYILYYYTTSCIWIKCDMPYNIFLFLFFCFN